jgi:DNA-damage-inducible protein J
MSSLAIKFTDVRSRVEPELKESATDVLAQCGLSLSDGIRLFLRQVVAQRGLPFEVKAPNLDTIAAMKETRRWARHALCRRRNSLMTSTKPRNQKRANLPRASDRSKAFLKDWERL